MAKWLSCLPVILNVMGLKQNQITCAMFELQSLSFVETINISASRDLAIWGTQCYEVTSLPLNSLDRTYDSSII
uniref:Uncharacterized protein n=1 Tax=Arion vulgaris TaxID=1028688 RepID=A0A0B7AJ95_9EUPU